MPFLQRQVKSYILIIIFGVVRGFKCESQGLTKDRLNIL
jgi:hypothetical protein